MTSTEQSYDEKLVGMTGFIIKLDKETAKNMAKEIMTKLPAWKD